MRVLDFIKKITKQCLVKLSFGNLSTRLKIMLALGLAFAIKLYLRMQPRAQIIPTMPIS